MKKLTTLSLFTIIALAAMNISIANELMVFPAKGQSNDTMEKDKYSCYGWAKGQTNFDPMAAPKTTTAVAAQQPSAGRAAARGAVGGAALGAILGDSSESARRGAAAGALLRGVRQRSANQTAGKEAEQLNQQQANQSSQKYNDYNRAYSACLEGKGYTVK